MTGSKKKEGEQRRPERENQEQEGNEKVWEECGGGDGVKASGWPGMRWRESAGG